MDEGLAQAAADMAAADFGDLSGQAAVMRQAVDEIGTQQIAGESHFLRLGDETGGKIVLEPGWSWCGKGFEEGMDRIIL